jgi:hypothetical protein
MDANIVKVNAKSTLYFILRPYSGKKKKKQVKLAFCFGRGQRQPLYVAPNIYTLLAGLEASPDVVNGVFCRFRECKFPPNSTY